MGSAPGLLALLTYDEHSQLVVELFDTVSKKQSDPVKLADSVWSVRAAWDWYTPGAWALVTCFLTGDALDDKHLPRFVCQRTTASWLEGKDGLWNVMFSVQVVIGLVLVIVLCFIYARLPGRIRHARTPLLPPDRRPRNRPRRPVPATQSVQRTA